MTNDTSTVADISFNNLRKLYIFALLTIAFTVLLSQLIVQYNLYSQLSDSKIINISGKQRMLSQKLTKQILILNYLADSSNNDAELKEANDIITLWKSNQDALQMGSDSLGFPKDKSPELQQLFIAITPAFRSIVNAAAQFIQNKKQDNTAKENQELVQIILKNQVDFLKKMNQIVEQYDKEALEKVTLQSKIEYAILGFTMVLLLLEFVFIFKPTNVKVEQLIAQLLYSEKKALQQAQDTERISEAKENSVKELISLNYAMENTLLYCRVAPNGSIIHIGEKFAKLVQYNSALADKTFATVLTPIENEQLYIKQIIREKQRTGWQGEINITSKNKESIWIDMSMVPVTIMKNESELLIICFEITKRKKAEKEVERLNIESTADKLDQQKIISSKIVESQENEQKRIAKEIHDGIGQMLTGLKFSLESINVNDKEKAEQKIEYLKKLSLDIIKGVRTATFNLMPPELTDHGIVSSLTKLTQELAKLTGKEVLFYNKTDFDQRLDSLIEINIYRLTQEAINNALKYAESTHIIVQLSHSTSSVSYTHLTLPTTYC
jgi:two-component system sensor histidine kinase DegS